MFRGTLRDGKIIDGIATEFVFNSLLITKFSGPVKNGLPDGPGCTVTYQNGDT